MRRIKEERLIKFWEFKVNPITGWVDDKRIQKKPKRKNLKVTL